jgi:ribosomal protein S18 acetylase RimI-like enzyme
MISISRTNDFELVAGLLRAYTESLGLDLSFQSFEQELATLESFYEVILLAKLGERAVGCVALRRLDEQTCEMKRLYIRPPARRQGAGHALVQSIIEEARGRGYGRIRLDTLPKMSDAIRLYESFGFRDIDPYRENPIEGARFMELSLGGDDFPAGVLEDFPDVEGADWDEEPPAGQS